MPKNERRLYNLKGHLHFVTFSTYKRRNILAEEACARIVVGNLNLTQKRMNAYCVGFVVMPNHVHALIGFDGDPAIDILMREWKKLSSIKIRGYYENTGRPDLVDQFKTPQGNFRIWQRKYYDFLVYSHEKHLEKMNYMHNNPVKWGIVTKAVDYKFSSARFYDLEKTTGVEITKVGF